MKTKKSNNSLQLGIFVILLIIGTGCANPECAVFKDTYLGQKVELPISKKNMMASYKMDNALGGGYCQHNYVRDTLFRILQLGGVHKDRFWSPDEVDRSDSNVPVYGVVFYLKNISQKQFSDNLQEFEIKYGQKYQVKNFDKPDPNKNDQYYYHIRINECIDLLIDYRNERQMVGYYYRLNSAELVTCPQNEGAVNLYDFMN